MNTCRQFGVCGKNYLRFELNSKKYLFEYKYSLITTSKGWVATIITKIINIYFIYANYAPNYNIYANLAVIQPD